MTAAVIEAMLLRWSDSHTGRTVTLLLPDDGDHPFKGLKCGPANGQRLAVSIALIADDESQKPIEDAKPRPQAPDKASNAGGAHHRSFHLIALSQQAGMLCSDPAFIKFVDQTAASELGWGRVRDTETAARFVRDLCGVDSRSLLDRNEAAANIWRRLVSDYRAWMREPEVVV